MNEKLIQQAQQATVNLQVAKAKGKFKLQAQKYEDIRKELEEYKLFLQPSGFIKPNKKAVGFKVLESAKEVVSVNINGIEQFDQMVNDIISYAVQKEDSINIGSAHTFIEMLKIALKNRRELKSKVETYVTKEYYVKTSHFSNWLQELNIKLPSDFIDDENKYYCERNIQYVKQDIKHLLEKLDKFSLGLAYDILMKLIEVEKEIKDNKLTTLKKLF